MRDTQADVEAALRALLDPPAGEGAIANLDDAVLYATGLDEPSANAVGGGGGKRIRPVLGLLCAERLGAPRAAAMPFACGIELMHNFALVHDDIEDGDEWRRGRPAVWKRHGLGHGVNVGDYLFAKIFPALLSGGDSHIPPAVRLRLFACMSHALDRTHRGQALDMNARDPGAALTTADYLLLVTEKTGHYLAAPMIAGAIVAGAGPAAEAALGAFGRALGPMFQIMDDVIDLTHGKGREATGNDIREGKRSYLVAATCDRAAPSARAELLAILDRPRDATTPADVDRALAIFADHDAPAAARAACDALRDEAMAALADVPEPLAADLRAVTAWLATRRN